MRGCYRCDVRFFLLEGNERSFFLVFFAQRIIIYSTSSKNVVRKKIHKSSKLFWTLNSRESNFPSSAFNICKLGLSNNLALRLFACNNRFLLDLQDLLLREKWKQDQKSIGENVYNFPGIKIMLKSTIKTLQWWAEI